MKREKKTFLKKFQKPVFELIFNFRFKLFFPVELKINWIETGKKKRASTHNITHIQDKGELIFPRLNARPKRYSRV